jgi:hypothetical protein
MIMPLFIIDINIDLLKFNKEKLIIGPSHEFNGKKVAMRCLGMWSQKNVHAFFSYRFRPL